MTRTITQSKGLAPVVEGYLKDYFEALSGLTPTTSLYDIVMREVEKPLIEVTLKSCQYNQKKAAQVLGINRNTLRRKMNEHRIELPSQG